MVHVAGISHVIAETQSVNPMIVHREFDETQDCYDVRISQNRDFWMSLVDLHRHKFVLDRELPGGIWLETDIVGQPSSS